MKTTTLITALLLISGLTWNNFLYGQTGMNSTNDVNMAWKEVSQNGAQCFVVNSDGYIFAGTYGVARSEDNGESWVLKDLPNTSYAVSSMAINSEDDIFLTTEEGKLYRSINDGDTWTQLFPNATDIVFNCIAIGSSDTIFIGTENELLRSDDNGESFEETNYDGMVEGIFISPSGDIFIKSYTLYRSVDNGNNWTAVDTGLTNTGINDVAFDSQGYVYAGTAAPEGGVFKSIDNGDHWTITDFSFYNSTDSVVTAIAIDSADNVIIGTFSLGVFFMKSDGSGVTEINQGVPGFSFNNTFQYDLPFAFINVTDSFMLAGFSAAILKSIQGTPSGILDNESGPTIFALNFPNPFNSFTTIQYTLPKAMYARVTVIDPFGRIIETLIDQYHLQGTHAVTWYTAEFGPGVYFYEIQADGFKFVQKMLLMR